VLLSADGLNTIAQVNINGKQALSADNMFRQWQVEVTDLLVPGNNAISVHFTSTPLAAAAVYDAHYAATAATAAGAALRGSSMQVDAAGAPSDDYWPQWGVPPTCWPEDQHGFCHVNMLRTEPCSFSWDWGPAFAPVGIYKNIELLLVASAAAAAPPSAVLQHVSAHLAPPASLAAVFSHNAAATGPGGSHDVQQYAGQYTWQLTVRANVSVVGMPTATIAVAVESLGAAHSCNVPQPAQGQLFVDVQCSVDVTQPPLWWPAGYGSPTLLSVSVQLLGADGTALQERTVTTGARQVDLIQQSLPGGSSFYFAVNGVPVWVKGSNWIPADAFESRITVAYMEDLFESYVAAGFNTIRNWGGGLWQRDLFYELADSHGLLVWEENMFACSLYPNTTAFLDNVAAEVAYQVRRLAHHPSIMLWAGNNENEVALVDNWYGVPYDHKDVYAGMYRALYWDTILPATLAGDPSSSRLFLASSPSNGDETRAAPLAANPGSPLQGDVHFYNYDANCWDASVFPWARFASEFGFQSWPSWATLQHQFSFDQTYWNSPLMKWRQHHPNGTAQLDAFIDRHFAFPNTSSSFPDGRFADTLWVSQLVQGLCMRHEMEHYRRLRDTGDAQKGGFTMGSLYWQANDIWGGASWSSVEYGGRWKVAHSIARNVYAPLTAQLVQATDSSGVQQLQLWLVNDAPKYSHSMQPEAAWQQPVQLQVWFWNGTLAWQQDMAFTTEPASAAMVMQKPLAAVLATAGCSSERECVLTATWPKGIQGAPFPPSYLIIAPDLKHIVGFADPKLSMAVLSSNATTVQVKVTKGAAAVAAFVWLDAPCAGWWEDNAFMMVDESRTLVFTRQRDYVPVSGQSCDDFFITVKSLWDRYEH